MADVKRYKGKSIAEAMETVRGALGPEALILSTKKLYGRDGLFEITAMPAGPPSATAPDPLGELRSELLSLRDMIALMHRSGGIIERVMVNPALLGLYGALIRSGVSEASARAMFERGGALGENPGAGAKKRILQEIVGAMEVQDPFGANTGRPVLAAFLGTTGVGKTTTIAKLAARLMLKEKKQVGLVSIDGYRIGAMEQLRIYANILGIPCYPAFCRKDLTHALKTLSRKDVVLIDTAGQSHYDKARLETLRALIAAETPVDCHLLLPVGMSEGEMEQAVRNFQGFGFRSYVFTKLDECRRRGVILNQILRFPLPVSYMTTGQNVPEDIEKADKRRLLHCILNEN